MKQLGSPSVRRTNQRDDRAHVRRDESFFTRKFLASNVDYESVRGVKAAVAAGVPLKELMRADTDVRGRVEALARNGAELDVLVGSLART